MQKIILASQSPRRKQLLEWAEVPFDVVVKHTDENYPDNLSAEEVAMHIAKNKALAVRSSNPDDTIVAADTIVVLNEEILGKPNDREHAIEMLLKLSGQTHLVITGVCILHKENEIVFADTTKVEFHSLTKNEIEFYVEKYKPFDKAGSYAIQEWIGVVGIRSIEGDFYNVMGLPVSKVVKKLQKLGG